MAKGQVRSVWMGVMPICPVHLPFAQGGFLSLNTVVIVVSLETSLQAFFKGFIREASPSMPTLHSNQGVTTCSKTWVRFPAMFILYSCVL